MLSPEQGWPEGSQYTLLLSVSFWNCIWRRLKSDSKLGISSFPSILTATIQTYLFFILSYSSTQMSPTTVSFLPFMFHTTFKIIFLKHWYNQKFFIFFNTPPLLAGYDLNVSRFLALVLVLVCGGCFLLVLYLKKKKKIPLHSGPKQLSIRLWQSDFMVYIPAVPASRIPEAIAHLPAFPQPFLSKWNFLSAHLCP